MYAFLDTTLNESKIGGRYDRTTYLYAVVALFVNDRNVAPAHLQYYVDHRFDLIVIAGYGASEVLEALFVGELRTRREKGDLQQ